MTYIMSNILNIITKKIFTFKYLKTSIIFDFFIEILNLQNISIFNNI